MESLTIFAICAVVVTVMTVVTGIVFITTLLRLRDTARQLEDSLRRMEPTISEIELAVREWREVGEHVSHTAESAERLSAQFEGMGTKAAQAGQVILSGIGGPVGRSLAVWNALKTGTDVLFHLIGKNHSGPRRAKKRATGASVRSVDAKQMDANIEDKEVDHEQRSKR